jgi:hypothetical protein
MKHGESLLFVLLVLLFESGCMSGSSDCPILVLGTNSLFGTYTAEILNAEGFNEFLIDSLTDKKLNLAYLNRFDVVILSEAAVTESQNAMFSNYVKSGGNLIAFRPDKVLSQIFGLIQTNSTIKEGYIRIDSAKGLGRGLVHETIQFHGTADIYKLSGADEIASLFVNAGYYTGFPSVVVNSFGKGRAAAFTYNLPLSIVMTRQGNPAWAGEERDKVDGPTATDLFFAGKGEVQWNNPDKIAIPQADEQMRLLSHIIENFAGRKKPIPRFWYFPEEYNCIFIFTIDGEQSTESDIACEIADVNSKGATATLYEIGTYISDSTVKKWIAAGNEVAIHYNDVPNYSDPTFSSMNTVFDTMTTNFRSAYGILPSTGRNHWAVWCSKDSLGEKEFAVQAAIEAKYGIGLDCNYYQFGGNNVYPNWIGDVGHFTGSGIPMKFADSKGRVLNVYQSNTQLPDETWLKDNIEKKSKTLIDRSVDEENYAYINANYHTWYWSECREPGLRVLDYCKDRGVPVWTAERVYKFLKMKEDAVFTDLKWSDSRLAFRLSSSVKDSDRLTFLLPASYGDSEIQSVTVNGGKFKFDLKKIKGNEYASLTLAPGQTYKVNAFYK